MKYEKIYEQLMCRGNDEIIKFVNCNTYDRLRKEYALVVSRQVSDQLHPMYDKKHSKETKNKIRKSALERTR